MGRYAISTGMYLLTFRKILLPSSSGKCSPIRYLTLRMEGRRPFYPEDGILRSSKITAAIKQPTWCNIPDTCIFNMFLEPGCSLQVMSSQGCRICDV